MFIFRAFNSSIFALLLLYIGSSLSFADTKKIVIGSPDEDWFPFNYVDNNGKHSGLFIDLLDLVFVEELGLEYEYSLKPWKRSQKDVENGVVDMFITVQTAERLTYTQSTDLPFFELYFNLFTYKGHARLEVLSQSNTTSKLIDNDITLVSSLGNGWHKANIESKGVNTVIVKTDEQMVRVLISKRVDGFIDSAVAMSAKIKSLALEDKLVITDTEFGPIQFHIMISNKSPFLNKVNDINKAMERLSNNGELKIIIDRYTRL